MDDELEAEVVEDLEDFLEHSRLWGYPMGPFPSYFKALRSRFWRSRADLWPRSRL